MSSIIGRDVWHEQPLYNKPDWWSFYTHRLLLSKAFSLSALRGFGKRLTAAAAVDRLHSPCSCWESTEEVMWHPFSGCQKMPETTESFFISYPETNSTSPQPFLSQLMRFGFTLWSSLMVVYSFEPQLIVFLPLWTIHVFHIGMLFLWFQPPWYPHVLVCWCINH